LFYISGIIYPFESGDHMKPGIALCFIGKSSSHPNVVLSPSPDVSSGWSYRRARHYSQFVMNPASEDLPCFASQARSLKLFTGITQEICHEPESSHRFSQDNLPRSVERSIRIHGATERDTETLFADYPSIDFISDRPAFTF
jgi:hypothetical protein